MEENNRTRDTIIVVIGSIIAGALVYLFVRATFNFIVNNIIWITIGVVFILALGAWYLLRSE